MKKYSILSFIMIFALLFSACKEDNLELAPIVGFTMSAAEVETQEEVLFFGNADLMKPDVVTSWAWDFGENQTSVSTEQNPSYVYTTAGDYTVKLTVTASNGQSSWLTKTITVKRNADESAHASFTVAPDKIMPGDEVTFTSTSIPALGATMATYSWDFGDNSPVVTTATAKHTYMIKGKYTVTLSVTDNKGNSDALSSVVNILDPNEQIAILWDQEFLAAGRLEDTNSPAMSADGNTVYAFASVGTDAASHTYLKAFDVASGNIRWTFDVAEAAKSVDPAMVISRAYASPSVGANGDIYIAGRDLRSGGASVRRALMFAVKANGTQNWVYKMGQDANFVNITPAIDAAGNIYVAYQTSEPYTIRVVGATGNEVKQIPSVEARSGLSLSKAGDIYFLSNPDDAADKGLFSYTSSSGAQRWKHNTDYKEVNGGAIAINTDGTVYSLVQGAEFGVVSAVAADGTQQWQFYTAGATSFGGVAIGADGTLYVNGGEAAGSTAAGIHAIDPTNGSEKWHFPTDEAVVKCVPMVDDRGYIHFITDNATYYVVTNEGKLYGKKKIGDKTVSSPVINQAGKSCVTVTTGAAVKMICIETGATGYANSPWPMKGGNPQRTHLQK